MSRSFVCVPWWPLLVIGPAVGIWRLLVLLTRRQLAMSRLAAILCPACGYDLRATPARCPECGTAAAAAAPAHER